MGNKEGSNIFFYGGGGGGGLTMGKFTSLEMTVTITAKIRVYCMMNSLVCEGYSLWQLFLPVYK